VTKPKERETGLSGFAVPIQVYSLIGSYVMATAEHREPYESRGSRTCLGARGGEIPLRDSTIAGITAPQQQRPLHPNQRTLRAHQIISPCAGFHIPLVCGVQRSVALPIAHSGWPTKRQA